ncbi:MAG TPA: hypothetical protein VF263_13085 [Longimicrobiaceae bacterium]
MEDTDAIQRPAYDPPYESPLEDSFAWHTVKYLAPQVRFEKQVEVLTRWGVFRMDFVLDTGKRRVGLECDGKDFHDPWRDRRRDALILGTGVVGAIYRFPGSAVYHAPEACLYGLAGFEPDGFSDRGRINLTQLASPWMRHHCDESRDRSGFEVLYEWKEGSLRDIVHRHHFEIAADRRNELVDFFAWARTRPERSLDALVAAYDDSWWGQVI